MKKRLPGLLAGMGVMTIVLLPSCKRDSMGPTSVKRWDAIEMKAAYEVPAPAGRTEEGTATLELRSDNSLTYTISIRNLASSDALKDAHIHAGDPATSGAIFIPLNPVFSGTTASGTVTGLRQGQVDTLLNMPVYINVHSNQVPAGLCRAQLDKEVKYALDIPMTGANETPSPITTTATGLTILRLTDEKTLYSKVTVNNLDAGDTLTAAHIHRGAVGISGPVRIILCTSRTDFGVVKNQVLPDSLISMLQNDACYANAHSKFHTAGIIRGQIR